MRSESQKKILEMLSEDKITVDEATALLSKLGKPEEQEEEPAEIEAGAVRRKTPRFLRVIVDSASGDKVNVRVPLSLIKTGIKLSALIPGNAADRMSSHGLDLSQLSKLDGEELIQALNEMQVDVESADGDNVRVFTE
ncbi:MAG: hypothetical protein JXA64_09050 [Candidatus Fermentibacteraceae bacterium]|nr:hypothetical protein [Candidatus Fermentibacteraceae bacterium]MBN2609250.1 hypothetical protein [Candidatus Fermentibacteraceae bacterium]